MVAAGQESTGAWGQSAARQGVERADPRQAAGARARARAVSAR